jgi:hypothetical protein
LGCIILHALASSTASAQTNSYWTALGIDPAIYGTPYSISLFRPQNGEDGARTWSQTKSLFFYGLGVVGVLYALPESATGWDRESDIWGKWAENVKEGPVWDRDNWAYNYIGHTYSGGVYYQVARKSGYRQWDAFFYSFLMSTFYWEYGVEAFAEPPSIQDLVVTPLLGWVYGEWAYQTEIRIRDRDNKVMGSKVLGGVSLFLLDPVDMLGRGVNRVVGRRWVKAGYGYFSYTAEPSGTETDHTVYLNMSIPIGGTPDPDLSPTKVPHFESRNDPVNSGIVGIAIGTGHTLLDEKWGVEDDFYNKISLGLYFTPRFSSRLAYARSKPLDKTTGKPVIYENYSLDAQYYLNTQRTFRPYVTAGFGEQMWNENRDLKTFQWNAGLGLHWQFHRKWALNADWINYYSTAQDTYDQNVNVGLIFRFGRGEHDDW